MPCNTVQMPDGGAAIICTRGAARCRDHRNFSKYQCDFPIGVYKSGAKKGQKRTCDKHLCDKCVMHGKTAGVDFCKEHYPLALEAHKRRIAKASEGK